MVCLARKTCEPLPLVSLMAKIGAKEKEQSERERQKDQENLAKEREKNEKDRRDKRLETRHEGSARKDNRDNDGLSAAAVAGATVAASMSLKKAAKKSDLTGTETDTPSQVLMSVVLQGQRVELLKRLERLERLALLGWEGSVFLPQRALLGIAIQATRHQKMRQK
jgi:hypothetical protein